MRFGVHCSIKNGLLGTLNEALSLKCETMQFFTRNPRIWKKKIFSRNEIMDFNGKRLEYDIKPLALHVSYLPNLATSRKKLYKKSVRILIQDLKLASLLNADFLVIHPGAYSLGFNELDGLMNIVNAINTAFMEVNSNVVLLLENVSGGGRKIGKDLYTLKFIIDGVYHKNRIGVCLDTAHAYAAGYDLSTQTGIDDFINKFDELINLKFLYLLHLNDSFFGLGSQKDRHQHIGRGYIGLTGFEILINHPAICNLPAIIETPREDNMDWINLSLLRSLKQ